MSQPFLGEIKLVSFNFAPKGWAMCNGQLLPINQNQALFSLLGTTFGGDGRVNFALPDNGKVQVIDTETRRVVRTLEPGQAILHLEFTPRGDAVWISARDDDRVLVYDTASFSRLGSLPIDGPSGIFFTSRAARTGF